MPVPKDHKKKIEKIEITLGEGDNARVVPGKRVVVSGIRVDVPDEALNDFELLDDLRAVDDKHPERLPLVLRRITSTQYSEILEKLRDPETGRVSVEAGAKFFRDLMGALNPNS